MNRIYTLLFIILSFSLVFSFSINGNYESLNRFFFTQDIGIQKIENSLNIEVSHKINKNNKFFTDFSIINNYSSAFNSFDSISSYDKFFNLQFKINELYISLRKFLLNGLDIKIGYQRIVLGVGDIISPVDIVNPFDLSDNWLYDKRLPVFALKGNYYINDIIIKNAFMPYFTPSLIPDMANMIKNSFSINPLRIGTINDTIIPIDNTIKDNFSNMLSAEIPIANIKTSLYYIYTRNSFPIPEYITLNPRFFPTIADIDLSLYYSRLQMFGLSIDGFLYDVHLFSDCALFFPEDIGLTIDASKYNEGIIDTTIYSHKYYYKYLFGMDYLFENDIFVSIQYLHGFLGEFDMLSNDYLFTGINIPIASNNITIAPTNMALQINAFDMDSIALIYSPEISFDYYSTQITLKIIKSFFSDKILLGNAKQNEGFELNIKYFF